jgi:hypothetical protein
VKVHGISNANEGVNGVGPPLFPADGVDRVAWVDSEERVDLESFVGIGLESRVGNTTAFRSKMPLRDAKSVPASSLLSCSFNA